MRFLMAVLLVATGATVPATAVRGADFTVSVEGVHIDSTAVRVTFQLSDPFPPADSTGPKGSTPAALAYTIELWRDRSGWFDALISSRTYGYRLEYDHLAALYRVVTPGGEHLEIARRDSLVRKLCFQDHVLAAHEADLESGRTYYLAITARLTPIDINQLSEVEGWLNGEIRRGARRGVLGVPKAVVRILADVAGFGDRSTVVKSVPFTAPQAARKAPE